jgi:hypothetical protein
MRNCVDFYLENLNAGEHLGNFGVNVGEISRYRLYTNIRPGVICMFGRHLLRMSAKLPTTVAAFTTFMRMRSNVVEHRCAGGCWL